MAESLRPASCHCSEDDDQITQEVRSLASAVYITLAVNGPMTSLCDRATLVATLTGGLLACLHMGRSLPEMRGLLDEAATLALEEIARVVLSDHEGSGLPN